MADRRYSQAPMFHGQSMYDKAQTALRAEEQRRDGKVDKKQPRYYIFDKTNPLGTQKAEIAKVRRSTLPPTGLSGGIIVSNKEAGVLSGEEKADIVAQEELFQRVVLPKTQAGFHSRSQSQIITSSFCMEVVAKQWPSQRPSTCNRKPLQRSNSIVHDMKQLVKLSDEGAVQRYDKLDLTRTEQVNEHGHNQGEHDQPQQLMETSNSACDSSDEPLATKSCSSSDLSAAAETEASLAHGAYDTNKDEGGMASIASKQSEEVCTPYEHVQDSKESLQLGEDGNVSVHQASLSHDEVAQSL